MTTEKKTKMTEMKMNCYRFSKMAHKMIYKIQQMSSSKWHFFTC